MYAQRFLFTAISLVAAILISAGAAVFHWATYGTPDALETPGIALGLFLILLGVGAIVAVGQRLEQRVRRAAGAAIMLVGLILAMIGRLVMGGGTATSANLMGVLLLSVGAYLVAVDVRRYWPVVLVGAVTVPILRFGEYAPLMGMPVGGWLAGATVGLVGPALRRLPVARVGLAMAGVAAGLLIAVPAASEESVFSSEWLALFSSLLWLAGWAFVGFAVLERWPAMPLVVATAAILCGAVLEGPIPLEEGWQATLQGLFLTVLVVPGFTAAAYLVGAFFGRRVSLPHEPKTNANGAPAQP